MTNPKFESVICYDHDASTEAKPRYFVNEQGFVIYKGTYVQCLCLVGGLEQGLTIDEIQGKTNGFLDSVDEPSRKVS